MKVGILLMASKSCNLDRSKYIFVILWNLKTRKKIKGFANIHCKSADGDPVKNLTDGTTII